MCHFRMENTNTDKDMLDLYFKLYSSCIKYKKEKDKSIDCDNFYKKFVYFSQRINNSANKIEKL